MIQAASTQHWYVRINGKIRGPFDLERICSMRGRGRLGPSDELSHDRRDWVRAGAVAEVFPDGFSSEATTPPNEADWFLLKDGRQQGPIQLEGLQALVQSGQLGPQDSVWKRGMTAWAFAGQVPEIVFPTVKQNWWSRQGASVKVAVISAALITAVAPLFLLVSVDRHKSEQARLEEEKWQAEQRWREEKEMELQKHREMTEAIATGEARRRNEHQAGINAIRSQMAQRDEAQAYRDQQQFDEQKRHNRKLEQALDR